MRAAEAVISLPANVPKVRRGLFGAITFVAWTAFLWLLTPLVTLVVWALGLRTAYDTTLGRFGSIDPALAAVIFAASSAAASALLLWAEVQRRRFTGVERRRRAPDATVEEMAEALNCDADTVETLRSGRVVRLSMRLDGSPEAAAVVRIPRPRRPLDDTDGNGGDRDARRPGPAQVTSAP